MAELNSLYMGVHISRRNLFGLGAVAALELARPGITYAKGDTVSKQKNPERHLSPKEGVFL